MSWIDAFFHSEGWLATHRDLSNDAQALADAEAIVRLVGLQPGTRVLDVPCGFGRIALPLAARGMAVTGVDVTKPMLLEASEKAKAAGLEIEWVHGDMRDLPWSERFDVALNIWGSFGYFDDPGNAAFAAAVRRTLVPGGRFVIDVPSLEGIAAKWQTHGWREIGATKALERRQYDPLSGRIAVEWTFVRDGVVSEGHTSDMRIYSAAELAGLLRRVGFTGIACYGGLDGSDYAIGTRLVMVATR